MRAGSRRRSTSRTGHTGSCSRTPAIVMEQVLGALEAEHGSVRDYLLAAGAEAAALDRLRARLRT